MKIGILGSFDPFLLDRLAPHETVVVTDPGATPLHAILGDLDGVVLRSAFKLEASHARLAARLRWIIRAGAGTENISPAFAERGVEITSVPVNARAVAELALGLCLSLLRRVHTGRDSLRRGEWRKVELTGFELRGKTLGILGFGRIGRDLARIVSGLDMIVVAFDRSPGKADKRGAAAAASVRLLGFEEVLAASDVLVACLPDNAESRGLLSPSALARLKETCVLVNVGRGSVIDLDDLHAKLAAGRLGGAGLDVYPREPPDHHPVFDLDNVVCTPHLGAQTHETRRQVAEQVLERIAAYARRLEAAESGRRP